MGGLLPICIGIWNFGPGSQGEKWTPKSNLLRGLKSAHGRFELQILKKGGIGPGHPKYKRLHWGRKVVTNSRKASMKLYQKKNPTAATYKPRKNVRDLGT